MRLRHITAAAFLPIPMLFPGSVQAAALPLHIVTVKGRLQVIDGGGVFTSATVVNLDFNQRVVLRLLGTSTRTLTFSKCAGGETRGVLTVPLRLTRYQYVTVSPKLQMFEGSSCSSNDLDGEATPIQSGVTPNSSKTWSMKTPFNSEIGSFDIVLANLTVSHTVRWR